MITNYVSDPDNFDLIINLLCKAQIINISQQEKSVRTNTLIPTTTHTHTHTIIHIHLHRHPYRYTRINTGSCTHKDTYIKTCYTY